MNRLGNFWRGKKERKRKEDNSNVHMCDIPSVLLAMHGRGVTSCSDSGDSAPRQKETSEVLF